MSHEDDLVARLDADAEKALLDAAGANDAGEQADVAEQQNDEPQQGSQQQEPQEATVSPEEQPVVTEPPAEQASSQDTGPSVDGLTLENAQERLRNAEAAVRGAQRKMTEATQEASKLRKENDELKVLLKDTREAANGLREQVEQIRAGAAQQQEPQKPDISNVVEDYGEGLAPLVEGVTQTRDAVEKTQLENRELRNDLDEIRKRQEAREAEDAKAIWKREILEKHPDAFQLSETMDFQGWLSRQTDLIQGIFKSGGSADVTMMFDLYKRDVGVQTQQSQQQQQEDQRLNEALESAEPNVESVQVDPSADTSPSFTTKQLGQLNQSYDEWVKNEAAIDAAMAAGNVR